MSSSKKIYLWSEFAAGAYLSWGPLLSYDPIPPPPPYTLQYIRVYTYSHRDGGEFQPERSSEGLSQSWVENTNMADYL